MGMSLTSSLPTHTHTHTHTNHTCVCVCLCVCVCVCVCVFCVCVCVCTEVNAEISFDTEVAGGDAGVIEAHVAYQRQESLERLGLLHVFPH